MEDDNDTFLEGNGDDFKGDDVDNFEGDNNDVFEGDNDNDLEVDNDDVGFDVAVGDNVDADEDNGFERGGKICIPFVEFEELLEEVIPVGTSKLFLFVVCNSFVVLDIIITAVSLAGLSTVLLEPVSLKPMLGVIPLLFMIF